MKRMTRSQFNLMADALKTAVREALSEEVNAIFAARIAAIAMPEQADRFAAYAETARDSIRRLMIGKVRR